MPPTQCRNSMRTQCIQAYERWSNWPSGARADSLHPPCRKLDRPGSESPGRSVRTDVLGGCRERSVQIFNDVVLVLQTNGQANQILGHTAGGELVWAELAVGGGRWMTR